MGTGLHVAAGLVTGGFWSFSKVLASSSAVTIAIRRTIEQKVGEKGEENPEDVVRKKNPSLWNLVEAFASIRMRIPALWTTGGHSPSLQTCNFLRYSSDTELTGKDIHYTPGALVLSSIGLEL